MFNNNNNVILLNLMNLVQRSLSKEDCEYLIKHVMEGAPGSTQFLHSEAIVPVMQMMYEEYRRFLKGEIK